MQTPNQNISAVHEHILIANQIDQICNIINKKLENISLNQKSIEDLNRLQEQLLFDPKLDFLLELTDLEIPLCLDKKSHKGDILSVIRYSFYDHLESIRNKIDMRISILEKGIKH